VAGVFSPRRSRTLFLLLLLFHASVNSALSVFLDADAHDEAKTVGWAASILHMNEVVS
jgi:hypothetical protein